MKLWVKFLIFFVVFAAVVAGLALFKTKQIQEAIAMGEKMAPPPPTVAVAEAETQAWRIEISTVGSLSASEGIMVSSEVPGLVSEILFESGQEVEAGDLLVVQNHAVETANLQAAEAQRDLAELAFKRSNDLLEKNTISQADFDSARAEKERTQAVLLGIKAEIDKKRIEAPFSGRLGIRRVSLGELLADSTPIVVLEASDPLYLDFTVPQKQLGKIKQGQDVTFSVDAFPEKSFTGSVQAISPRVNQGTRNVEVRVSVPNPDGLLRSGMFVRLRLDLGEENDWVVIPDTAITYNPYGNGVFVVRQLKKEDGSTYEGVRQIFVDIADKKGDLVAIRKGIEAGDRVVVAGGSKLVDHSPVLINNEILPDAKVDPQPAEG